MAANSLTFQIDFWYNTFVRNLSDIAMAENTHTIEIYSTPTCHFCKMAKEFFTENDFEYEEHNVAENAEKRQEMIEKTGQIGVPVIVIDNEKMLVGFDRDKVAGILGVSA